MFFIQFVVNDALTVGRDELDFFSFFFGSKAIVGDLLLLLLRGLGRLRGLLQSPGFVAGGRACL